jgi:HSP20 family protein
MTTGSQEGRRRNEPARFEPYESPSWQGPFGFMRRMMDEMDRMFEDFGMPASQSGSQLTGGANRTWMPRVDVRQDEGQLVVRADLPGVKQEDVHVEVDDGALHIRAERRDEHQEKQSRFQRSEVMYGSFARTIPLPDGTDLDNVKACFTNGVLEITIPTPERRGRRIEIASTPHGGENATKH